MSLPFITVLISTYNYGRFIEESIESVLSQHYPAEKKEIVVVDDGSTDDTSDRVRKYGSKVRYFFKPNGGQASALNLGFARARGEIICLLDADDFFLPGKLARVAEAFQQNPVLGMFYHPFLEFDMETNERRESQFPLISGSPFENLEEFVWYFGPGTSVSFRRKYVDRLLPIPESIRMLADGYLGSLIVFVAPIQAVPECLAAYRFHGKNAFHADEFEMSVEIENKRLRLFQIVIEAMRKWLNDNGYSRNQLPVRYFLDFWTLIQCKRRFLIEPPGRFRFFGSIVLENYVNSLIQNWKLTAFNYLTSFSALGFGYKRRNQMYEWRGRVMKTVERVYRTFVGGSDNHGSSPQQKSDNRIKRDVEV
jgi:glycosyltransferase involved in cell wall biosynthesis